MKCCGRHFSELQRAIGRKGLAHMVSPDDIEAKRRLGLWLSGAVRNERDFDPMLASVCEANGKCREMFGDIVAARLQKRLDYCPFCVAEHGMRMQTAGTDWIDNVTDRMVIVCHTQHFSVRSTSALVH